jgi:hypothetical protein
MTCTNKPSSFELLELRNTSKVQTDKTVLSEIKVYQE